MDDMEIQVEEEGLTTSTQSTPSTSSSSPSTSTPSSSTIHPMFASTTKPVSTVWKYFTKVNSSQASCNKCKKCISTPTGTTSSLIRHLNVHPAIAKEFKKDNELKKCNEKRQPTRDSSNPTTPYKQLTLHSSLNTSNLWPDDSKKSKAVTEKIATWMVKSFHSYSLVEETGFRDLMKETVPLYKVPSRTTFSRTIVPNLYSKTKENLLKMIDEIKPSLQSISYTTDIWSSNAGGSFMSFTAHYMTEEMKIKRFALGALPFPGEHSGALIREKINDYRKEWNLLRDLEGIPNVIVTDNARNMGTAFSVEHSDLIHLSCFAHTIQLCISDAKKEVKSMQNVLAKARTIVGHYKHSPKSMTNLEKFQKSMGLPVHKLYQDVDTRWNSEFLMLQRLVEQRGPINAELATSAHNITPLTADEWKMAENYVSILQPLHHATNAVSEDSFPTLSLKIPILHGMLKFLTKKCTNRECGSALARALHKAIMVRFPQYKSVQMDVKAMVIDPRFKDVLLEAHEKARAQSWLLDVAKEMFNPSNTPANIEPLPAEENIGSDLFEDVDIMSVASDSTGSNDMDIISNQLTSYLSSRPINRSEDPCLWWRNHPELSALLPIARRYLPIPATSVSSERLFSGAGNVVTERRQRLTPEHIEQLTFLHENL